MIPAKKAGIHQALFGSPPITMAGNCVPMTRMPRNNTIENTPVMYRTGIPRKLILAGEALYRSGRRVGKAMAAMATMITARTPARTINPSRIWKVFPNTLQITNRVMIALARRIAGIGEWKRSFTSDSFSGISRSNDQAKNERIGMYVLAIIEGRLQNMNEPTIRTVRIVVLNTIEARNG